MLHRGKFRRLAVSQFLRDEQGTVTIESVLWMPVYVVIMVAAIDATILYLHHTEMWNVSRDVARRIALGDMTEADAAALVQKELSLYSSGYVVATGSPADPVVRVRIQTQIASASVFGFYRHILGTYMYAQVTMRREGS